MGQGKTEAICHFAGLGAKDASRKLAHALDFSLPLTGRASRSGPLRFVPDYPHLGTRLAGDGSLKVETTARRSSAAGKGPRCADTSKMLGRRRRIGCEWSMMWAFSLLTYNAATWPSLTPATERTLNIELEIWVRDAVRCRRGPRQHVSFEEINFRHCTPRVATRVKELRLRYFGRLVSQAPDVVWALLQQLPAHAAGTGRRGTWKGALRDDL